MKKLILAVFTAALATTAMAQTSDFNYSVDRFADIEVLSYQVPGFEDLSLQQKELVYYLTEAALNGRDILFDQNCKYNLMVRETLEDIYRNYKGDKNDKDYQAFVKYLKQVWFGNGIHHHYSMDKFIPEFSKNFFDKQFAALPGADKRDGEKKVLDRVIFDPTFMAKRVNQADGEDLILTSACNMYEGVTQQEVEDFYNNLKDTTDLTSHLVGLELQGGKTQWQDCRGALQGGRSLQQGHREDRLLAPEGCHRGRERGSACLYQRVDQVLSDWFVEDL